MPTVPTNNVVPMKRQEVELPPEEFLLMAGATMGDMAAAREELSDPIIRMSDVMLPELDVDELESRRNKGPVPYSLPRETQLNGKKVIEDHEPDDKNDDTQLYKKLESLKDKVPVGGDVILHSKSGQQFWYKRSNEYSRGFYMSGPPGKPEV